MLAEVLAAAATGLFAGAALYLSIVEHPARLSCGAALAVAEFGPSYHRAAPMQASLALIAGASALWTWIARGGAGWLIGAVLIGSVIPFTLLVVRPINDRLLAMPGPSRAQERSAATSDRGAAGMARARDAEALLRSWGKLHLVRTVASMVAFAMFLLLLAA